MKLEKPKKLMKRQHLKSWNDTNVKSLTTWNTTLKRNPQQIRTWMLLKSQNNLMQAQLKAIHHQEHWVKSVLIIIQSLQLMKNFNHYFQQKHNLKNKKSYNHEQTHLLTTNPNQHPSQSEGIPITSSNNQNYSLRK